MDISAKIFAEGMFCFVRRRVDSKAMRSANAYACYAKTPEFRVIPGSGITVFNENNSVTLTLTTGVPFR